MADLGRIAESARGELPETFAALEQSSLFGPAQIDSRVKSVAVRLFGDTVNVDDIEDGLNDAVVEYAGKLVALKLITPGIDYWSKQSNGIGASGRNETKTFQDRAKDLKDLRVYLLSETRQMWLEVSTLLPNSLVQQADVPSVRDVATAYTPDPNLMEPAFGVPSDSTRSNLIGDGASSGG